ncbi:MAG: uroporphyrinogen decarboxylase family protein [Anaerolineae bacterium]|nr:uroporphyrinogen decarboxylase [Anaerolineae bacterium]MDW8099877.1 uroporphyrinogen decarboxylase family protein [Anaerolineae bacterium]
MSEMSKRERLEATFRGQPVDRVAVALWRHWPVDDQRAEDLARSTIAFQREFDFDFIKVTPSSDFCLEDWGTESVWLGDSEGTRQYVRHPVHNPSDWEKLPVLDPGKGGLGRQVRCLELIGREVGDEVPFIQTIFSPLAQAKNLAGERLLVHMRRHPDALRAGLETITQTTIRFIEAIKPAGVAGIFYAVQHASYQLLSEQEYQVFGRPYDLRVLEAAQDCWFNLLHLHGADVMFDLFRDYPVQAINWHDQETPPSLREALGRFPGAVLGGINRVETLVRGEPDEVMAEARAAISQTNGMRLIVGTGCVTPIIAPIANIRAARQAVERD